MSRLTLSGVVAIVLALVGTRARGEIVTYTIDSANSGLGVTGNMAGQTISGAIGFVPLSGMIDADRTANTVTFLPNALTGDTATADNRPGKFPPGEGGDPFGNNASANFAFVTAAVNAAVRGLRLHPENAIPAVIAANGKIPTSSFEINIDSGTIDFARNDFQFDSVDMSTPNPAFYRSNASTLQPTITQSGATENLVLPFKFSVPFSVFTTGDSLLTFTGEIDASRDVVPEPASLLLLPAAAVLRRRRR